MPPVGAQPRSGVCEQTVVGYVSEETCFKNRVLSKKFCKRLLLGFSLIVVWYFSDIEVYKEPHR